VDTDYSLFLMSCYKRTTYAEALICGANRARAGLGRSDARIAHCSGSTLALVTAQYAQALPRHILGDLAGARQLYRQVMEYYREEDFNDNPLPDRVSSRIFGGYTEWYLGYPDRAVRYLDEAISIALRQDNPVTAAFALAVGSFVDQLRRDYRRSIEAGDEAVRIATASGLPHSNAVGKTAAPGRVLKRGIRTAPWTGFGRG
jgi:hypothetical protein